MISVWDLVVSFYLGGVVVAAVVDFTAGSTLALPFWKRALSVLVWPCGALIMLLNPVTQEDIRMMAFQMAEPPKPTDGIIQIHWLDPTTGRTEYVAQGGDFISDSEMGTWILSTYKRLRDTCPVGWEPIVITAESRDFLLARA